MARASSPVPAADVEVPSAIADFQQFTHARFIGRVKGFDPQFVEDADPHAWIILSIHRGKAVLFLPLHAFDEFNTPIR
jgi:hypothetical protein